MEEDYNSICSKVPELKEFSLYEFMYCINLCISRASVDLGHDKDECLIPYGDMLNHGDFPR